MSAVATRPRCRDDVMSNFDHQIDEAVATRIKESGEWSAYAGWNFHGRVWWTGEKWACEVWCYHEAQEVVTAPSLEELMEGVSSQYGAE